MIKRWEICAAFVHGMQMYHEGSIRVPEQNMFLVVGVNFTADEGVTHVFGMPHDNQQQAVMVASYSVLA
jgi:hypothetical protein